MSRSDVISLQIDYSGNLEGLALDLQLQDITYDQEMTDGKLDEYVYGSVGAEIIEAIRPVDGTQTEIFRYQPAGAFSRECLAHILISIEKAGAKVTSYWTRETLAEQPVLHEGANI